jgi:Ca2+-binding RTX toxin-like protein
MLRRAALMAAVVALVTVAVAGAAWAVVRTGTNGPDNLVGTLGQDQLYGLAGADTLNGRAGNDDLIGGRGNDTLLGGAGGDASTAATAQIPSTVGPIPTSSKAGQGRIPFTAATATTRSTGQMG